MGDWFDAGNKATDIKRSRFVFLFCWIFNQIVGLKNEIARYGAKAMLEEIKLEVFNLTVPLS